MHTLSNTNTSTVELNCILHMYGITKAIAGGGLSQPGTNSTHIYIDSMTES